MFFVEAEDAGAVGAGIEGDEGCTGAEFELACAGAGDGAAGGGVVEEVEGFGAGGGGDADGEEGAEAGAFFEAGLEAAAPAGEGFEGMAGGFVGPDGFGADAAGVGGEVLGEASDPEEGEERAGVLEAGEDGGEEEVGDGGGFADGGEAGEGIGGVRRSSHRS